jgi:hypothetical protein
MDTDLSIDDDGDTIDITPNRPLTTEVQLADTQPSTDLIVEETSYSPV